MYAFANLEIKIALPCLAKYTDVTFISPTARPIQCYIRCADLSEHVSLEKRSNRGDGQDHVVGRPLHRAKL